MLLEYAAAPVLDPPKSIGFGGSDTHLAVFLKILSSLAFLFVLVCHHDPRRVVWFYWVKHVEIFC